MTFAHLGGLPIEEMLLPLATSGGTFMASLGLALRARKRRPRGAIERA